MPQVHPLVLRILVLDRISSISNSRYKNTDFDSRISIQRQARLHGRTYVNDVTYIQT